LPECSAGFHGRGTSCSARRTRRRRQGAASAGRSAKEIERLIKKLQLDKEILAEQDEPQGEEDDPSPTKSKTNFL